MARHSEDELIDSLTRLVALWKAGQHNDGRPRPLEGRFNIHDLDTDMYVVKRVMTSPARLPSRPHRYPIAVIEDLIYLGYLLPTDGPGAVTYLHPTTDALFLTDITTRQAYRTVFHRRYQRLRSARL
jgi:hypothetical protein